MLKDIFNPTFGFFHIFPNCGLKQPKENKARTLIVTNRSISVPNSLHRNVKTIYTGVNIWSGSKKCPKTRTGIVQNSCNFDQTFWSTSNFKKCQT